MMPKQMSDYKKWLHFPQLPEEMRTELEGIAGHQEEIDDRFYRNLSFGTGG